MQAHWIDTAQGDDLDKIGVVLESKRFQQESATRIKSAAQAKGMDNPALMWDLVRRYGEAQAEMTVHWLEETLNVVEKTMKS